MYVTYTVHVHVVIIIVNNYVQCIIHVGIMNRWVLCDTVVIIECIVYVLYL